MSTSFFYKQVSETAQIQNFANKLEEFAEKHFRQIYLINRPLGDNKSNYSYKDAVILLVPGNKLLFLDFGNSSNDFAIFKDDFIEDLGHISNKFGYKDLIGRPREWEANLVDSAIFQEDFCNDIDSFLNQYSAETSKLKRHSELLVSLLTGSINDVDKIKDNVPDNLLDKIKQKIILFDGDQTSSFTSLCGIK